MLRNLLFLRVVAVVIPFFSMVDDRMVELFKVSGNLIVLYALFIPIALRQSFMFSTVDLLCGFLRLVYYYQKGLELHELLMLIPSSLFIFVILWSLEYSGMVSYVLGTPYPINAPYHRDISHALSMYLMTHSHFSLVTRVSEHVLLPQAVELYNVEYLHARRLLHAYVPNIPPEKGVELYHPRRYRNCSVMAIHVKAADVLPGLVDVPNVAAFLKEIGAIIESCVLSCELVNVAKYSGIFLAACPDMCDDEVRTDHATRTITCLKDIQTQLDLFSRANGVSVALGVGIACGPVSMGFLGGTAPHRSHYITLPYLTLPHHLDALPHSPLLHPSFLPPLPLPLPLATCYLLFPLSSYV